MKTTLLLICLGFAWPGCAQTPDRAKIALPDRIWIASKIYSSVQTYFGHWQAVPDLDLDAVFKSYLQQISETDDRMAFDLASKEFLARLRNGHSHFDDGWFYNNYGQPLGFFLRSLGGKWVVTETRIADLSIGDAVQTIDGKAIGEFVTEKQKYVAASSDSARRKSLFYSPFLFPERFTLTLDSSKTVRIDRRSQKLMPMPARTLEGRMIQSDIGYFRIPSFGNPKNEGRAVEFVRENTRAKCLIFDVRGNGGGSSPERLIRALMDRPYRDWMQSSSLSIGLFGAYRQITNVFSMEQFDERTRGY